MQELNSAPTKVLPKDGVEFDNTHAATPRTHDTAAAEQFDADNWVARYPGQNSPHIGNGTGGVR